MAAALPRAEAGVLSKFLLLTLVALAVGVAGGWVLFERDEGEDEDENAPVASGWNTCTNFVAGFSIEYPAAWYTDHPAPEFACTYFDPRRFELARNADWEPKALQVIVGPEDAALGNPTSRAEVTVGGRRATRFERPTAEGLVQYGYVVEDADRTLLILTTFNRGVDYSAWKRIVDRAADSLVVTVPRPHSAEGADAVPPQAGLPEPVARKREAIWKAAKREDYAAVAALAEPNGFEYSFGGPVAGGPAAYWRRTEETTDERPLPTLAAILELPYVYERTSKLYVWPFAFTRNASTLTPDEQEQLTDALGEEGVKAYEQSGNYLGYRAGIDEDGDWVFYVAGD